MAENNVPITAGSGTNIATYTDSASNRRQVVILGDTAAGIAPVDSTNGLSVTLTTAVPTGANTIGAVNIASAQTLATVTTVTTVGSISTSVTPGTSAAHLGKAEDAAHTTGDTGVAIFGVRSDTTPSSTSGTAGDYSLMNLDANGRTYVNAAQYDSGGTSATDTTAHAVKVLQVDSTGAAVGTAVAATTDAITAKLATDSIQNGLTALTPKFAKIAASSSGNNTLVTAVSGKKIRVLAYNFIGNGAVNAKFQDGASGTDLTGLKYIAATGGGICAPFNPVGWFEGSATTLMNLNLSGAVAVGGEMVYVEV